MAVLAVFSVKDLFDSEVGEFSIVNAVLENVKDKGHDVVCFNIIRVLDVLLSNYMDDLFKATDMSHLEFIVRTILVLFRDENGSIVVESTDAIPSFVEGVQDSYNCQQLSVSPLSPFFKTLIEQLFDVASRDVNEEDVVNSSFAAWVLCASQPLPTAKNWWVKSQTLLLKIKLPTILQIILQITILQILYYQRQEMEKSQTDLD